MKVYGPYQRKDGRFYVNIIDKDKGVKTTKSYPRIVMEELLGRPLDPQEYVDHIDNDHLNNDVNNYQLLSNSENVKKFHAKQGHVLRENAEKSCVICGKGFRQVKSTNKYCSEPCYRLAQKKISWPPLDELLTRLAQTNYTQLGRELGVSDNAIRKHIKASHSLKDKAEVP